MEWAACPPRWRPLSAGRGLPARPPQGPGSWGQQVSLGGRVVTPEAGDLGMGLPIRNICQEDVPSAVHCGKMFYQRSLS